MNIEPPTHQQPDTLRSEKAKPQDKINLEKATKDQEEREKRGKPDQAQQPPKPE